VWQADLTAVCANVADSLSEQERKRAAGFRDHRKGELWARSRGVLRDLVARYLNAQPASLQFATGRYGKPRLAVPGHAGRISFNLSHSGPFALYAFAKGCEVGVDVQRIVKPAADVVALARRALGPEHAQTLARMAPARREREFVRAWVQHEARLKCSGSGIWTACCAQRAPAGRPMREPWLVQFDVEPGAVAAIACETRPAQLMRWSFSPLA
jgi:4'-phosphopantetheinyl transferase